MSTNTVEIPRLALRDRNLFLKLVTNPLGAFSTVMVTLFVFAAIFAEWLAPFDPRQSDYNALKQAPSSTHVTVVRALDGHRRPRS